MTDPESDPTPDAGDYAALILGVALGLWALYLAYAAVVDAVVFWREGR